MVMSTKEQETFETSLAASDGFELIKAGLSRVDVRQVRIPPKLGCCPQGPGCDHTSHPSGPLAAPLSDWQAECRNIEDKNQILRELEQGVGSDECNRLVVSLMRKALVTQAKAAQAATAAAQAAAAARQLESLAGLLGKM